MKQRGSKIAGRPVELIVADTGGQPANAKTKIQELVERNQVHVVIGPLAAFEALAISDYVKQAGMPIISDSAGAEDLTQRAANPWFVRAVSSSAQPAHALAEHVSKKLGYKRVAMLADDLAFGHELSAGFQRVFEENGGTVVQKLWPPLNVADYGSYIAQIDRNVDAVFIGFAGANGLRFLKQYAEYGMSGTLPVIGHMTAVDEGVLKNMGDEALGVVSSGWYSATLETPANKAFADAIRADYGADPGYYTVGAYMAGLYLEKALETIQGNVEDRQALMKALRGLDLPDTPIGPVKIDEFGNPILNIYIRKVERVGGKLVNTVTDTYPGVSQFWTYDPKEFLKNPVYSRDWQPAKN